MARAEAGEALAGPGGPVGAGAEGGRPGRELEEQAFVMKLDAERAKVAAQGDRLRAAGPLLAHLSQPARPLELLERDHPLGQLDELVPRFARRRPQAEPAYERLAAAPDLEREGVEADADPQPAALEDDRFAHSILLSRRGRPAVAIR